MPAYYNENDKFAAQWLRNLISRGLIADGVVDERSIEEVEARDDCAPTATRFVPQVAAEFVRAALGGRSVSVQTRKRPDSSSRGKGHPILFGMPEAEFFGDFPDGGGYPKGFLQRAFDLMGVTDPHRVLHVCSGSMKVGVRVDIRPEMNPTHVCDVLRMPFEDGSFRWVMADPPYSREYAKNLYGTEAFYPDPHALVNECLRVLEPGGRLGFMHHIVPKFRKPGRLLKVYTITQGVGYNVRAWTLFTKDEVAEDRAA